MMSDWKKLISDAKELLDLGAITDVEFEIAKQEAFALRSQSNPTASSSSTLQHLDDMGTRIHSPSNTPTSPPQNFDDMGTMVGSHQTTSGWDNMGTMVGNSEPETIGSYRIVELLGQGGMGAVYKGRHINEQYAQATGDIAIKMIQPYLAGNEEFKSRFIKEAIFGKNLTHPNIASVIDVVDDGGVLALLMDFVEGQELKALIPAGGMPVEEVVRLLKPIASALDYLHEQGIVHRDMKPANVRVKPDGTPVILDFGIAKDTNEVDVNMTQTGTAMGTQTYMAPEQMDAKNVTGAADQYALAMMAYQMLSGKLPWSIDESSARITVAKMTGGLKYLSEISSIKKSKSNAVMKGLSLTAKDRYPSCVEFVAAICNSNENHQEEQEQQHKSDEPGKVEELERETDTERKLQWKPKEHQKEVQADTDISPYDDNHITTSPKYLSLPVMFAVGAFSLLGLWFVLSGDDQDEVSTSDVSKNSANSSLVHNSKDNPSQKISPSLQENKSTAVAKELEKIGITMIPFTANFNIQMGSPYDEVGRDGDEDTTTASIDNAFAISDTEITQRQYKQIMGINPAKVRDRYWGRNPSNGESCAPYGVGDNLPVHCVSWLDAIQFCNDLSAEVGLDPVYTISSTSVQRDKQANGFRLPTEVEWIYAARGATRNQSLLSSSSSSLCDYANVSNTGTRDIYPNWTKRGIISCEDSWTALAPVRSQLPVRKLYDMTGNLWEWTWSKYTSSGPNERSSSSISYSNKVVLRGGAWQGPIADYRLANRYSQLPKRHSFFVGFRIARNHE